MEATRKIGMKMLRRVARSTTSPSTRGCWRTMLMLITTSRTRPTDSPSGPSTNIRASRAMYTLLTDPMGVEPRQPPVRWQTTRACVAGPSALTRMHREEQEHQSHAQRGDSDDDAGNRQTKAVLTRSLDLSHGDRAEHYGHDRPDAAQQAG